MLNPNETLERQNSLRNRSENAKNRVEGKRLNYGKPYFCRVFSKRSHYYCSSVHQSALSPQFCEHTFRQMLSTPYKNINNNKVYIQLQICEKYMRKNI